MHTDGCIYLWRTLYFPVLFGCTREAPEAEYLTHASFWSQGRLKELGSVCTAEMRLGRQGGGLTRAHGNEADVPQFNEPNGLNRFAFAALKYPLRILYYLFCTPV